MKLKNTSKGQLQFSVNQCSLDSTAGLCEECRLYVLSEKWSLE